MPKSVQGKAKQLIHEMYLAPTEQTSSGSLRSVHYQLSGQVSKKRPSAWRKTKIGSLLFTTSRPSTGRICAPTNPIESTFATVRLRTQRT